MSIGFSELILILIVSLIFFGGKRLPELAHVLGKISYEYKKIKTAWSQEWDYLKESPSSSSATQKKQNKKKARSSAPLSKKTPPQKTSVRSHTKRKH